MSSGSVRLNATRHIHQHEDPPEDGWRTVIPDSPGGVAAGRPEERIPGRLWREDGRVMYQRAGGGKPEPARVVWARPLSDRGGPVSIVMAGKKRELAFLASLDELPAESRRVAEEELAAGMILPRIKVIYEVKSRFGNYYWDVETDMGRRTFLLTSPENNSMRPRSDVLVIKDVSGNCYEINPVSGLDKNSLRELDRVL